MYNENKPSMLAGLSLFLTIFSLFSPGQADPSGGLQVNIAVNHLLDHPTNGRAVVLFSPTKQQPLDNTGPDGGDFFWGKNFFGVKGSDSILLSGGQRTHTRTDLYGFPNVSLSDLPTGDYFAQAFFTKYEKAYRSDGSVVEVRFPCGDGSMNIDGPGSLRTDPIQVTVTGGQQTINLDFNMLSPPKNITGNEIGSCNQGNYADTPTFKHIKIRSEALSKFWGRDMYVGANVALPPGYDANDKTKRYPVVYSQSHWPGEGGAYGYPAWTDFQQVYDSGTIPTSDTRPKELPTPKMILVTLRHESPFYDDSYAVNSANMGPWGDAINDELVPHLDKVFNTIPEPYGRIQEGGSTGGWISIASTIFRPDLYGACFSFYPDSLDFHRHQDINLYDYKNAYYHPDGSPIGSIRNFPDGKTENILVTTEQENHWEITSGTSSRSQLQWDVWNTVFGVQGLNGYPLEPWNKVTGEIYPEAVKAWKKFDLSDYLATNWEGKRQLGKALRHRLHVSVGTQDNYYLNEGVAQFQKRIEPLGGKEWANITFVPDIGHGGFYKNLDIWDYLLIVEKWVKDHAPDGPHPLSKFATSKKRSGNEWKEIIAEGGRGAALRRQSNPAIKNKNGMRHSLVVHATSGNWDPGMNLKAQWLVARKPFGDIFPVPAGQIIEKVFPHSALGHHIRLQVTGLKPGYIPETRQSDAIMLKGKKRY